MEDFNRRWDNLTDEELVAIEEGAKATCEEDSQMKNTKHVNGIRGLDKIKQMLGEKNEQQEGENN